MMQREIGSEFWSVPSVDKKYLLSGRSALEYIIRDVMAERSIRKVLLPSYCCHTMIEPFARNGFSIRFYDIYYDSAKGLTADVPAVDRDEMFYYMTYFGFSHMEGIDLERIRREAALILEDRTHSYFGAVSTLADYSYASLRKWAGFYGIAEATKRKGSFSLLVGQSGDAYCEMRRGAMEKKKAYLFDGQGEKAEFLNLYREAEGYLEETYVGLFATAEGKEQLACLDREGLCAKRKENAEVLFAGLREIPEIILPYNQQKDGEVPLFVPILVEEHRDSLRKYLIDNRIYCPVHWPLSEYHEPISKRAREIYQRELSLICDQRYNTRDMQRVVRLIQQFMTDERKKYD